MLDQAASSLTNFGLTFILLRSTTLAEFGAFTVAFLSYQMALNLGRAVASEPLLIRFSAARNKEKENAIAAATGVLLALGVIGGIALGASATLIGPPARQVLLVTAVSLPFLLVQDGVRFAYFAAGTPRQAFWNDVIWGTMTALLLAIALITNTDSLAMLVSCWALAGAVAAFLGAQRLGIRPRVRAAIGWIRDHGDLGRRYIVEYGFAYGSGYLALLTVSLIAGLSALGAINGTRILFGPITVLYTGMMAFAVPEGVRLLNRAPTRLVGLIRRFGVAITVPALVLGTALYLLPRSAGQVLVHESDWSAIRPLLAPTAILVAAQGYAFSRKAGLRIVADARQSMWAQILASPLALAGAAIGAGVAASSGAAWGMAFAAMVSAIIWTRMFARSREIARAAAMPGES